MKKEDDNKIGQSGVEVPPLCSICGTSVPEEDWILSESLTCVSPSCIREARETKKRNRVEYEKRVSARKAKTTARAVR